MRADSRAYILVDVGLLIKSQICKPDKCVWVVPFWWDLPWLPSVQQYHPSLVTKSGMGVDKWTGRSTGGARRHFFFSTCGFEIILTVSPSFTWSSQFATNSSASCEMCTRPFTCVFQASQSFAKTREKSGRVRTRVCDTRLYHGRRERPTTKKYISSTPPRTAHRENQQIHFFSFFLWRWNGTPRVSYSPFIIQRVYCFVYRYGRTF